MHFLTSFIQQTLQEGLLFTKYGALISPSFWGKYGKLRHKNTPKMLSAQTCVLLLLKRECNVVFKSEI